MSTTPIQIVSNGNKVTVSGELNGPASSANGVIMNSTSAAPTVNGNGQLGASGAMFNLAKIASSDQKQPISSNTATGPTSVVIGSSTHNVVCTGSVPANSSAPQVINVNAQPQPRLSLAQQNNSTPRPSATMSQPLIVPRGTNTISLPPGVQLPPGTILMQNDKGQIVFMSRAPAPQQNFQHPPTAAATATMHQAMVRHPPTSSAQQYGLEAQRPFLRHLTPQAIGGDMSHHTSYLSQQPASGAIPIQPNPGPGQVIMRPAIPAAIPQIRPSAPANIISRPIMPQPIQTPAERSKEEIKKCKNFLETLIRLSSQQPRHTLDNVKKLIQGLLEGSVKPDVFTNELQKELNSQKQPGLAAFLKKSLPELRKAIKRNELTIEGLNSPAVPRSTSSSIIATTAPQNSPAKPAIRPSGKSVASQKQAQFQVANARMAAGQTPRPAVSASSVRHPLNQSRMTVPLPSSAPKGKQRLDLKDDDDINDVAAMGGVNLSEETKNILAAAPDSSGTLRSCRDDVFLSHTPLAQKIRQLALQRGVKEVNNDVISLVSHACEERLRHLTEKVSLVAEHRLDLYKMDKRFESTHDVRSQIKFLEELDKLERKKHDDSEREVLLKAAKSRSKTEDPEQAKLKIKAREMKEQELEELRQQEANKTALAAIGPRKKRKFDEMLASAAAGGGSNLNSHTAQQPSSNNQGYNRPRLKRVNLRDLTFVLEEDKESYKSDTIFKAFLR